MTQSAARYQPGFAQVPLDPPAHANLQFMLVMVGAVLLVCALIARKTFDTPDQGNVLAMIAALLLGGPIVLHAARDLLRRSRTGGSSHMEELVALAFLASFASGEYVESALVALFMVLASFVEDRTAAGARQTIESLVRLTPTKARRINIDGSESLIAARDLAVGDRVVAGPGDNVPCDGVVISGHSAVDEKSITGESLPIDKTPGSVVFAGSINMSGLLQIRVERAVADSTLGRVQSLILQAAASKTVITRMLDQYAGYYTPVVLCLAGAVLFFTHDLNRAISLLLISCPCAIILSGPTALVAALTAAARVGVLVKNVTDIETARKLTAIVFDKTGTLTTGTLSVTQIKPVAQGDAVELLTVAASLEQHSRHPIARAVAAVAQQAKIELASVEQFHETAGCGVQGQVQGVRWLAGRESWLRDQGVAVPDELMQQTGGLSLLLVAIEGRCLGWIGMEDQVRPGADAAMFQLQDLGVRQRLMVTGDRPAPAQRIAASLPLTGWHAQSLPADKLDIVEDLKRRGHVVAVVGDGVNDGPALAAAHLSIAMGAAGSDVAINAASIALMNSHLNRLPFLIRLSQATARVVRQNIVFVMLYVAVMLTLLGLGYVTPLIAAIAHGLSSIVVVFNSARLIRQGEDLEADEHVQRRAQQHRHRQASTSSRKESPTPVGVAASR
jgi:Cd2+/Zn2+-exporting ATPase